MSLGIHSVLSPLATTTTTSSPGTGLPQLSPQVMIILVVAGLVLVFAWFQHQQNKE